MTFAREQCIADLWTLWAILLGNLGIAVAYAWIPTSLVRILVSASGTPQPGLLMLAVAFISSCGLTHAAGIVVIFRPYYGLESGLLLITAAISLFTGWVFHARVDNIRRAVLDFRAMEERLRDLERQLGGVVAVPAPAEPEPAT